MSLEALNTLQKVREFLATEILPVVAGALHGELRAALKVLNELELEIDAAPGLLRADTATILSLCTRALAATPLDLSAHAVEIDQLKDDLQHAPQTLAEAQARFDRGTRCLDYCIEALQKRTDNAASNALLADCYAELGQQVQRRAQWQSVFKPE